MSALQEKPHPKTSVPDPLMNPFSSTHSSSLLINNFSAPLICQFF
jgi:hypothetical protein